MLPLSLTRESKSTNSILKTGAKALRLCYKNRAAFFLQKAILKTFAKEIFRAVCQSRQAVFSIVMKWWIGLPLDNAEGFENAISIRKIKPMSMQPVK